MKKRTFFTAGGITTVILGMLLLLAPFSVIAQAPSTPPISSPIMAKLEGYVYEGTGTDKPVSGATIEFVVPVSFYASTGPDGKYTGMPFMPKDQLLTTYLRARKPGYKSQLKEVALKEYKNDASSITTFNFHLEKDTQKQQVIVSLKERKTQLAVANILFAAEICRSSCNERDFNDPARVWEHNRDVLSGQLTELDPGFYRFKPKQPFLTDPSPELTGAFEIVPFEYVEIIGSAAFIPEPTKTIPFFLRKPDREIFIEVKNQYGLGTLVSTAVDVRFTKTAETRSLTLGEDGFVVHNYEPEQEGPVTVTIKPTGLPELIKHGTLPIERNFRFVINQQCAETTISSVLFVACDPKSRLLVERLDVNLNIMAAATTEMRQVSGLSNALCGFFIVDANDQDFITQTARADYLEKRDDPIFQDKCPGKNGFIRMARVTVRSLSDVNPYKADSARDTLHHELGHALDDARGEALNVDHGGFASGQKGPVSSGYESNYTKVEGHAKKVEMDFLWGLIHNFVQNTQNEGWAYWRKNVFEGFAERYRISARSQSEASFNSRLEEYVRTLPNMVDSVELNKSFFRILRGTP